MIFFSNSLDVINFIRGSKIIKTIKYSNWTIQVIEKNNVFYLYCPEDACIINDYIDHDCAIVAANIYWRKSKGRYFCD